MIHRLADLGNTVVVIEHNLEVIKTADWVIDLGPEAGMAGGDLVAEGTPEEIVKNKRSQTGRFLKPVLAAGPLAERPQVQPQERHRNDEELRKRMARLTHQKEVVEKGKPRKRTPERVGIWNQKSPHEAKAPWEIDGRQWHTRDRVARNGRPARWDGRILERIVDQVEALSRIRLGYGLRLRLCPHRLVATQFRADQCCRTRPRSPFPSSTRRPHPSGSSPCGFSFRRTHSAIHPLENQLDLVPFHESETPVLCDLPRLKITDVGPFQEITIVGHAAEDFDTPGFDAFLRKAVAAFLDIGKPGKIKKASELG